ncbi:D-arabinono-1,4-lactone oxidase [Mycobacterium sp. SMC-4]|uniref:D-arabinono-1,4-lactone oxidase n=1 Tax=Mycobacterium sp. SMC-4 TaxID=2857059 RepID=UPI0021B28F33|nr:D-arabinono-1,4-lactone oxidase [Mycobacterium sp. SMC-4]UXA18459.1 FAD-binding protein [Mycobacterium sp. SMC-4]
MGTPERREWVNWSESLRFTPGQIAEPRSEDEVAELVRDCAQQGRVVRPVGKGHSSMPLVQTDDVLVDLHRLSGVASVDKDRLEAVIHGGSSLIEVGDALHEHGLALENYGDVDYQALSGAIGTGTHGTGIRLGNFSSNLLGFRLVTGDGEVREVGPDDDDGLRAGRVALGALGIFTLLRLRVVPALRLRRREWCVHIEDCLDHLDALVDQHRNFDFYWHPRREEAQLRTLNEPDQEPLDLLDQLGGCDPRNLRKDQQDWSRVVQPADRGMKFDEIEYALPIAAFRECFAEVRDRVKERHRQNVGWRVLCRSVAADDGYLSPFSGRDSMTIALLQNNTLPYQEYFDDMEPILVAHGGRPHFGKKHSAGAEQLRRALPDYDAFRHTRRRFDPHGTFLNDHLRHLLDEEAA